MPNLCSFAPGFYHHQPIFLFPGTSDPGPESGPERGPERFYYDKASHTGAYKRKLEKKSGYAVDANDEPYGYNDLSELIDRDHVQVRFFCSQTGVTFCETTKKTLELSLTLALIAGVGRNLLLVQA